ncbi:adenylate kinase [Campylobacter hyointestinalis]|uniref:adenylate kinase n=1 Tax=Campylobacter hyointestinalis TaxID=198 RepID=UPI001BD25ABA|nr:adenylate kinase [Campylobacter hyointestinalis]MBT0611891.1 adenylate kinase [Campylobacter hyointestinalis subsp. hyointestinalis]MDY2999262.1 adenylate kinase [Campylobacter hyointestinalis]
MKKLFLIIGAPGSGKTTDASMIAANDTKFAHYSTGDLLRAEVASGSELGKLIDSFISKGNLVPLEVVVNAIISAIRSSDKNYILIDGYPRSLEQMRELDRVLASQSEVMLDGVIEVDVSEEVARNRILGRARGADDNNEVFNNRMKVYLDPIKEIRAFYNDKKLLHTINGERTIETIVADMKNLIENLIKG